MEQIARTAKQIAAAMRRQRRQLHLTQEQLAGKVKLRQATISRIEAGEPATRLQTLLDALAALNLEIVIRPRTKSSIYDMEKIF